MRPCCRCRLDFGCENNGGILKAVDSDSDGLCDPGETSVVDSPCTGSDLCPHTPIGQTVDAQGCSAGDLQLLRAVDSDLDGVCNRGTKSELCTGADLCPTTPATQRPVDANGCSQQQVDSDMDGVCNRGARSSLCYGSDLCPRYPGPNTTNGCPGGPSIRRHEAVRDAAA